MQSFLFLLDIPIKAAAFTMESNSPSLNISTIFLYGCNSSRLKDFSLKIHK